MKDAWRRFKVWYLGPEFPPGYIPLKRVGMGPIPFPGERRRELRAHTEALIMTQAWRQRERPK